MEICQKPENAAKCQNIYQQFQGNNDYAVVGNGGNTTAASLPACNGKALLNHSPIELPALAYIEGLGHFQGEHIMSSQGDHIYIHASASYPEPSTNVYSPGDVTLLQVTNQKGVISTHIGENDYALAFSPCRSVMFGFIHIRTLSNKIQAAMQNVTPICQTGTIVSNCTYPNLSVKLSSGELIGTATGWDFGFRMINLI